MLDEVFCPTCGKFTEWKDDDKGKSECLDCGKVVDTDDLETGNIQ